MDLKKVRYIILGLAVACFALILVYTLLESILVLILALLLAIASIVFNLAKWRCPHCGEHLGRSGGKYCPHCGNMLDDLL